MGVLKVRDPATRTWIDITSSADEVEVSSIDPAILNSGCELWYDINTEPGVLKARVNGAWEAVDVSEVAVGPDDPYTIVLDATDQLWYDTNIQALMVRVNDNWQPVVLLDPNEVFVGASTPTPDVEIWYDTDSTDALPTNGILKVRDTRDGSWHVATPEEVWVDDQDPLTRGNSEAELWFDLSLTPPVLKANVSGAWVPVSPDSEPPLDEVWVGQGRPDPVGTYELWVDTSTDPPLLYGKNEAGAWVPLTFPPPIAPPNEVVVSPSQPMDQTTELWVDSTLPDPVLRANIAGAWVEIAPSEVEVSTSDPYLNPAGSRAELWHDRSTGQNGILKVRINNDWRPVAELAQSETEISATDPIVYNPSAELWVDTSSSPVSLWGRVNNGWVKITGPVADAPEEVNIGPVDPRDSMVELWYDTTNTPGTLKANNFGTWEPIGESEVTVDNIDPYLTDPNATAELWFNPSMGMLSARFNDQWLEVTPDPPNEVSIQGSEPSNPDVELWHDISTDPPVLKAKVHQVWTPVIPAEADEVYVGAEDPDVVEPDSKRELWYDTDAWGRGSGGFPGGNANEALVKVSDVDSDVRWGGDLTVPNNLLVNGDATMSLDAKLTAGSVRVEADGQGLFVYGGGGLIKKAGAGIVLRKATNNTHPVVENNDGTNATNIITANGAAQMTGVLQWPNAIGPKIQVYAATFGIGVESGELSLFGSSKVGFRANASNGAYFGYVDAGTGGGLIIDRDNCDARYMQQAAADARYAREATASIAMTVGTYYEVIEIGGDSGANWTVSAADNNCAHTVSGCAVFSTTDAGRANVAVYGNQYENAKIFDYVCVGSGSGYAVLIRCVRAGTYTVGWSATSHNDRALGAMGGSNVGVDYGGCGI